MEGTNDIKSVFWIGTAVMLFLAFALLFLVLFYQNYFVRIKRKEAELLLKASLESEKQERTRIAADLHDSVSSDLSAIRNYLSVLLKQDQDIEKKRLFQELKDGVETAIENTRMVSYSLMPPLIEVSGLAAALEDLFEKCNKSGKARFTLKQEGEFRFSPAAAYELFRVVQEFTTNMQKYGKITVGEVMIRILPKQIIIVISDNGVTFDFKVSLNMTKGTGLKNINSRLKVLGATLLQLKTESGNHFEITLNKEKC